MLTVTTLAACLATGTVGGVFFAFSVFVMRALAELPPSQGVAAMQRINVTVLTPLFLGPFIGAIGLLALVTYLHHQAGREAATVWSLAATLVYALGAFGATVVFHVPRNERLARLKADSPEAVAYWPIYVREWLRWNHVRAVAALVSLAACAGAWVAQG
jgi:uncharacterized membrane protein